MSSMNSLARLGMISVAVAAVMLAGGCSGSESASSKAGGTAPPVVLQMGNAYGDLNGPPAIQYFVSQVEERSGGNLRVESKGAYGDYADDAEQQVVRAVAAGQTDLGWAGTRVFDTMGATSFQALQNFLSGPHSDQLVYMVFDLPHLNGRDLTGARFSRSATPT